MTDTDRKMYIWSLQNYSYFIWLYGTGFTATTPLYIVKCIFAIILFPILFPIISVLFPAWDKLFGFQGEFYVLPISLHNDKNQKLCRSVQSKMFWYIFLNENNIKTPIVYYYLNNGDLKSVNKIPDKKLFIMKPEYGTEGSNISKVTLDDF